MVKKLFRVVSLSLALVISPCGNFISPDTVAITEAKTYVYYVSTSYAYHSSKNCWTLKRSKKTIKKATLKKARNKLELKPCGVCYK
ncbi:MAG: hypothetical protein OSJ45_13500 [Lachnospiraceae bacterium]|nr:hypothetical protein [Lachnospiraceae bacterium]